MNSKPPPSIIKSFSIYGLFGTQDVHINFDENIKIIIGENGLGKTQILNIFYYLLTKQIQKIGEFPFDKIYLCLADKKIEIIKKEIIDIFENESIKNKKKNRLIYIESVGYMESPQIHFAEHVLDNKFQQKSQLNDYILKYTEKIESVLFNHDILYFPTFRRVEEDLHNLGYEDEGVFNDKEENTLIHFGMDDVQKRFNILETKIDSLLKEGFTKISSEILSKLVKGFGNTNKKVLDKISDADLDIILARVGDQLSEDEKLKIRAIVTNREASNTDNSLFYFIQALVDIYEKQKEFDIAINKFKQVCNNYLINKKVVYDESKIKIYIKSEATNEPLALSKLSSGEKQIISIFSKIYLSDSKQRFIVLFDEPELSLSMLWQKQLLPDIVNSNKCDFLLAVTHSPFIFDNELDRYAVGLNEYVTPIREVTS